MVNGGVRKYARLTEQIITLNDRLKPSPAQYELKAAMVGSLSDWLRRQTGGELRTFGSCENGFWLRSSDVDACLVIPGIRNRLAMVTKIRAVESLLKTVSRGEGAIPRVGQEGELVGWKVFPGGIANVQSVLRARIPVTKIFDTANTNVMDVSVNNLGGIENSTFLQTMSSIDPRVSKLGRVIKHWATQRNINDRSRGTLSTYTILLQLLYTLQTQTPPIIPRFLEIADPQPEPPCQEFDGVMRKLPFVTNVAEIKSTCPSLRSVNNATLGELFAEFFNFWGHPSIAKGIEVVDGEIVSRGGSGVLVIRCPLTGADVNKMNSNMWSKLHDEFSRAREIILSDRPDLTSMCTIAASRLTKRQRMQMASRPSALPPPPPPPPPPTPSTANISTKM